MTWSCPTCGHACSRCGSAFPDLPRVGLRTSQNLGGRSGRDLLRTETVAGWLGCSPQHVGRLAGRAGIEPAVVIPRGRGRPAHRWTREQANVLAQMQVVIRRCRGGVMSDLKCSAVFEVVREEDATGVLNGRLMRDCGRPARPVQVPGEDYGFPMCEEHGAKVAAVGSSA